MMNKALLSVSGLLLCTHAFATTETAASAEFQLLSDDEIRAHQQQMQQMSPEEREKYRNEQYQLLQERARANGYQLPDTPPWASRDEPAISSSESIATEPTPSTETVGQPAAGVAATEEAPPTEPPASASSEPVAETAPMAQSEAPSEQAQQPEVSPEPSAISSSDTAASAPQQAEVASSPAMESGRDAYRDAMRRRFEQYMANRNMPTPEEIAAQREQRRAAAEALRKAQIEQADKQMEALEQQIETQRRWARPMPPYRPYGMPYGPYYPPTGSYPPPPVW